MSQTPSPARSDGTVGSPGSASSAGTVGSPGSASSAGTTSSSGSGHGSPVADTPEANPKKRRRIDDKSVRTPGTTESSSVQAEREKAGLPRDAAQTNLNPHFKAEAGQQGGKSKRRKRRKKLLKSKRSKSKRRKFPAYLYPKGECGAQSPRGIHPHYCGGRRNKSKKVHRRTRRTRRRHR
jgi:hypothetical protein